MTKAAATDTPIPTDTPVPTDTPTPTPTPTNTPTPTPIPYELSLSVVDEEGNPISGAAVIFPESGEGQPYITDETGKLGWSDLPGEMVSLAAAAQGYFPTDLSETIKRGPNELTLVMERNPAGILPSEACQAGQEILYLEDFEDGVADNLFDLIRPAWSIGDVEGRGKVLSSYSPQSPSNTGIQAAYGNAVWSFDLQPGGPIQIMWHGSESEQGGSHYMISYYPGHHFQLHKVKPGMGGEVWGVPWPPLEPDTWQHFNITYFDGSVEIWLDGELIVGYDDPDPIIEGNFGFILFPGEQPITATLFDNIVVCSLSEPFQPIAESEE
jgi:hypothetical protein